MNLRDIIVVDLTSIHLFSKGFLQLRLVCHTSPIKFERVSGPPVFACAQTYRSHTSRFIRVVKNNKHFYGIYLNSSFYRHMDKNGKD